MFRISIFKDELEGLPDDYFTDLKKDSTGNKYLVSLKYPELFPILQKAKKEETRKKMDISKDSQVLFDLI